MNSNTTTTGYALPSAVCRADANAGRSGGGHEATVASSLGCSNGCFGSTTCAEIRERRGRKEVRRTRDRRRHAGEERDRKKKWWAHHLLEIEASVRAVQALPTFGRFQRPVVCGLGNKFYLYI
jgi:hypothetical protein